MPTTTCLYRVLLRVLPASFREEFAEEMAQVFEDQLARTRGGGRVALWLTTAVAVAGLSLRLRLDHAATDVKHAVGGLLAHRTFTISAAIAAGTVLQSVLYEVQPRDPPTLAGVGAGLLLVCWVATYLPARRALTVNPADALRAD